MQAKRLQTRLCLLRFRVSGGCCWTSERQANDTVIQNNQRKHIQRIKSPGLRTWTFDQMAWVNYLQSFLLWPDESFGKSQGPYSKASIAGPSTGRPWRLHLQRFVAALALGSRHVSQRPRSSMTETPSARKRCASAKRASVGSYRSSIALYLDGSLSIREINPERQTRCAPCSTSPGAPFEAFEARCPL